MFLVLKYIYALLGVWKVKNVMFQRNYNSKRYFYAKVWWESEIMINFFLFNYMHTNQKFGHWAVKDSIVASYRLLVLLICMPTCVF